MSRPGAAAGDRFHGLQCSRRVSRCLRAYVAALGDVLRDDLVGVYLCGSLAHGCFHPATSDVDVFAVTARPSDEATTARVLDAHRKAGIPVDAAFIARSQVTSNDVPTPFDFLVKPTGGGTLVRSSEGSRDLLLLRQDVHEAGIALAGPPAAGPPAAGPHARHVVPPVPWDVLAGRLNWLFPHIVPRFRNPVLMLCRVMYAFANRGLCSKRSAGEWALDALDAEWHPLIREALTKYAGGVPDDGGPTRQLRAFEAYCGQLLNGAGELPC